MNESQVVIWLAATDEEASEELLEEHMFAVLEAVEEYATDTAEGPVVAVDFDKRAIELAFSLNHETQSEAQRKIAEVLQVVERHTPVSFEGTDSSVRKNDADDRSLVLCD